MIKCIENSINKQGELCSIFILEPLNLGHATTINAGLRRILLAEMPGIAIGSIQVLGMEHEYTDIFYIRESAVEFLLNIKKINFKALNSFLNFPIKGILQVNGPKIVTANDIDLFDSNLVIINPSQYICSIVEPKRLNVNLFIEKNYGYKTKSYTKTLQDINTDKYPFLFIDSLYNPIIRFNSRISLIHDKNGLIKESLMLEIYTNGSISPAKALKNASQNLLNIFYPLTFFN